MQPLQEFSTVNDRVKREYLIDKLFWLRSQVPPSVPSSDYEYIYSNGMFTSKCDVSESQILQRAKELELEISNVQMELEALEPKN